MSQMGVYRLYRLGREANNKFSSEMGKRLERDLHVITNEYAQNINDHSEMNGIFYEKDEKATELYLSGKPFKSVKEYIDFEEVKPRKAKSVKTKKEDTENNDSETLENND